jgi:hypothetical protein
VRHGLNQPFQFDAAFAEEVQILARQIAGSRASADSLLLAARIAETQIDLHRVHSVRQKLLLKILRSLDTDFEASSQATLGGSQSTSSVRDRSSSEYLRQLKALNRYDARARSQRRFAIHAFEALLLESSGYKKSSYGR